MRSRVNLVVILLTLFCVVGVLESSRSSQKQAVQKVYPLGKKVFKDAYTKAVSQNAIAVRGEDKTKMVKTQTRNKVVALSKDYGLENERPRRRRRKMDRTMIALLMAYKMKFMALIPTMVGGLVLLKATALLAGFFFALFAAVLGLKVH